MALKIRRTLLEQLRKHGEQTYPHECCGILVGTFDEDGNRVEVVEASGNTRADSPHNRYQISPADLLRAQREANAAGLDIVGFYHSHPDHPARWSSTDLAEAHWTGCSYVITSVEKGKAILTNSFLLVGEELGKHFEDEPLAIEEDGRDYLTWTPGS
jgi:proteasome lid subunit RPN8/RPN11